MSQIAVCPVCKKRFIKERIIGHLILRHKINNITASEIYLLIIEIERIKKKPFIESGKRLIENYYQKNCEKILAYERVYYLKNREKILAHAKAYRLRTKRERSLYQRNYYLRTIEIRRAYKKAYWLKKKRGKND